MSLPSPLTRDFVIQDVVHGRIWLTELERKVIDTAPYQRLRFISQLGLSHYVFPTAMHTRFAHSLGATHVMGLMLQQPDVHSYITRQEGCEFIQLLRLAALCHDIGHYPFSHLGENVYDAADKGAIDRYENGPETVFDVAASIGRPGSGSRTDHEVLAARIVRSDPVRRVIDALPPVNGKPAAEVVASLIEGSHTNVACRELISSDLDCDRLDYLVRDSEAADLAYGHVDLAYLIENLLIARHPEFGQDMLCLNKRHGRQAAEHFLTARYYHYAQFITHKTVVSAELLLAAGMLELIRLQEIPSPADIASGLTTEQHLSFTEQLIWSKLYDPDIRSRSSDLDEVADRLLRRHLLKVAVSQTDLEPLDSMVPLDRLLSAQGMEQLAAKSGVPRSVFCFKRTSLPLVGRGTPSHTTATRSIPFLKRFVLWIWSVVSRTSGLEATGTDSPIAWRKAVKLCEPEGVPELLVMQDGLIRELSNRNWVTRRVFVRESSGEQPYREALRSAAGELGYI